MGKDLRHIFEASDELASLFLIILITHVSIPSEKKKKKERKILSYLDYFDNNPLQPLWIAILYIINIPIFLFHFRKENSFRKTWETIVERDHFSNESHRERNPRNNLGDLLEAQPSNFSTSTSSSRKKRMRRRRKSGSLPRKNTAKNNSNLLTTSFAAALSFPLRG